MSEYYTDRKQHNQNNQKNGNGPQRGARDFSKAKDQPTAEIMSRRQDHGPHKTMKKRKTYRKNRKNLCITNPFLSVYILMKFPAMNVSIIAIVTKSL